MAQWITRLPTEQKIAGSNPAEVEIFTFAQFNRHLLGLKAISTCYPLNIYLLHMYLCFRRYFSTLKSDKFQSYSAVQHVDKPERKHIIKRLLKTNL